MTGDAMQHGQAAVSCGGSLWVAVGAYPKSGLPCARLSVEIGEIGSAHRRLCFI